MTLARTFEKGTDFLTRETEAEYHKKARENLSSHQLADFRKCPALYHKKKLGLIIDDDRPAFVLGRAVHTWALEGREVFDRTYTVGGPINSKTGKPYGANTQTYADWAAAQGKPVLTDDQFSLISKVVAGIQDNECVRELLSNGTPEGVVRAEYCGTPCQIRMDWFNADAGIVDLKTCDDLTWFEADARRYGYAHQLAFYRAVLATVTHALPEVHLIAVEKKEPYRCGVWVLAEQTLTYSQRENEAAIDHLKTCELTGHWPSGYEERRVFDAI